MSFFFYHVGSFVDILVILEIFGLFRFFTRFFLVIWYFVGILIILEPLDVF
jgi:hypothetical protein